MSMGFPLSMGFPSKNTGVGCHCLLRGISYISCIGREGLYRQCHLGSLGNNSIYAEKASEKIQHPFIEKTLRKPGIEGHSLNLKKIIYKIPTFNIIPNGERFKSSKIRKKESCFRSLLLFDIALDVLSSAIKQEQGIQTGKEVKLFI